MCRRRLLKSNFYINYGGTKKAHGETVIVSPFVAGGNSDTFELYARNPWVITNNLSWLTVSSLSNKSGKYTITITAAENQAYSERSGSFTAKTLDDRFSIVVSVSQQAKPSVRYIEIVPATASISSLGTTSFTCILHDNGTETDVTSLVEWSSSDTNAATISNGTATGRNNTKTEKQVTITAVYDGLSATATLNVAAGAVSWRNYRILIGASEDTINTPVNLDATNITNGVGVGTYIDEYVNEVKVQTWAFTEGSDWSIGDDSIARLEKISEEARHVFSVYNDGAFYPDQRTTEITATTKRGTQTFTATKIVNVAPQGLVTHYISVEPTTATIGSTGEVQLKVLYHTVTDGVDDDGVDVTTSAGYTDNGSDLIDVNATGKVNGSGAETGGNAVVTVSYPGVESIDVPITVRDATVDYRNFRVIPLSMTLSKDDVTAGEQIQAYVDVFVNNVFSEELEVTADASWSSKNANVASVSKSGTNEVVKPVYGDGYFPTTRTTQVQASYLGSAATCDVSVEPEGRIERYIEVTPSPVALGATGSAPLTVKLYTKTDGVVDAGVDVTTSCSYASDSQIITVNNSGIVTANNTGETEVTANITVSYPDVDSVKVPAVSSPANIEHELLLEPQGSTTLGFEEGCTFKLYYITKINGTEASREEVTSNITWDPIATEKGHMAGTTFMNEWFSTAQTTVDVCATYNGIKSNNVVLTLNGADSITYSFVVTPSSNSINYNGTSQMSAEYVTYVNGAEYNRETVQPSDVSWSENSTASTISNSGLLTASNNSSAKTVTATVTGTYLGVSGTANVTIGKAPGINVSTPSNWHLSSGAGSDEFYVTWVNLKPGTNIVLSDENIESYNPTEIQITSSNYADGTVTVYFDYSANPDETSRKIYLYATGTGLGNETETDSDYFEQSAKTIERNIQVSVVGKVTSNEGGTCDYVLVSWTGLTVGTWIDITGTNAGVSPEIQVTATTGSIQLNNQPSVTENEGSSRTIRIDAKWREDNSVSDYDSWTQNGGYVPPVVYTYELEITPAELGTQPYSGTQAFTATVYRLIDGVRDESWSEDVTNLVDWDISTDGGDFTTSSITTGGMAEWFNNSSSTGQVTISAWLDEPEYGSPEATDVTFTVEGREITYTITFLKGNIIPSSVVLTRGDGSTTGNGGFEQWVITGITPGEEVSYIAKATGCNDITNTLTINEDKKIYLYFTPVPVEYTDVIFYIEKVTGDDTQYITTARLYTNGWSASETVTASTNASTQTITFSVPNTYTSSTFGYEFTIQNGESFDKLALGGPNANGFSASTISEMNSLATGYSFNQLNYMMLTISKEYMKTAYILVNFDCDTDSAKSGITYFHNFSICDTDGNILRGLANMAPDNALVQDENVYPFTYSTYEDLNASTEYYIGGGIGDGGADTLSNYLLTITKGSKTLYDGDAYGMYFGTGSAVPITLDDFISSRWYLRDRYKR